MIIKVCGVTTAPIARAAVDAGADWIGLVFERSSPRWVDDAAADAVRMAVGNRADVIGVMVEPDLRTCNRLVGRFGLAAVQLHGRIDEHVVVEVDAPVIRGMNIRSPVGAYTTEWWPDGTVLLDAFPADGDLPGGTGRRVDVDIAREVARHRRTVLAGGLGPGNVEHAVIAVRPWGVDASSGLERTRGVKDEALVRQYIEAARRASAQIAHGSGRDAGFIDPSEDAM